jgi:hypothetical protein
MQVQTINNTNNTNFGASFKPNKALEELYNHSNIDKKTVRLARRFARKHQGQEIVINNFVRERDWKSDDMVYSFDLQNLSNHLATQMSYSEHWNFNINKFLGDLLKMKWFFSLGKQDKVEHYLTGTKKSINKLLNQ